MLLALLLASFTLGAPPVRAETSEESGRGASVAEARRLADAKQFAEAARVLERVLARDPKDQEARSLLARVLAWSRRYDESIVQYRRLLADDPSDSRNRAGYARVLAWSGRSESAVREFRRAIRSDPKNLETRIGYARALAWTGDLAGASMEYHRILRSNPKYGDAWLGYATVARWRGAATASDRFLARAAREGADPVATKEERDAVERALAPSVGGGWTTAHERQYVEGPDFTIESTGPFGSARTPIAKNAEIGVRVAWLNQFERNDATLNYDLDMTVLRAGASLLRGYPFQASAGFEVRTLDAGSANVLYPLLDDDDFTGWNGRVWRFTGRFTPAVFARREYLPIKTTAGPSEILAGHQSVAGAELVWQGNGRATLSGGYEHGRYSDDNERSTARAGAAYRFRIKNPGATIDYGITFSDFDTTSISYFTPLESRKHAVGLGFSGYAPRGALDYGARYQYSDLHSENFGVIVTNTWSAYLNATAFGSIPLGLEGSYSRDNNDYETWSVGLYGSARW